MSKIGKVIIDEEQEETKEVATININESDLTKEFNGKKKQYQYFDIKNEKLIQDAYEIRNRYTRDNGK